MNILSIFTLLIACAALIACTDESRVTGTAASEATPFESRVDGAFLSNDGVLTAVAKKDQVCVWNNQLNSFQLPCVSDEETKLVTMVRISGNGKYLLISNQMTVYLKSIETGKTLAGWYGDMIKISDMAISDTGRIVAFGMEDGSVKVIDIVNGTEKLQKMHRIRVNTLDVSKDGKLIASGSSDKKVMIWDASTGNVKQTIKHGMRLNHVAFSPDASKLFTVDATKIRAVWNVANGEKISDLDAHMRYVEINDSKFSKDSRFLIAGSPNQNVWMWDTQSGDLVGYFKAKKHSMRSSVLSVAFVNESEFKTVTSDGFIESWNIASN